MRIDLPPMTELDNIYPESDGLPMAENTKQFEWIVIIKENLEIMFRDRPDVFVAGDLFWYPVEGEPGIRRAPDTMVVFGCPKRHRRSYLQWMEKNIPPQVVFEVLSPGNTRDEMAEKFVFYDLYGVEEYYIYDPDTYTLEGWQRTEEQLQPIPQMNGWISPRLGIRFVLAPDELLIFTPDGEQFVTFQEMKERTEKAERTVEKLQRRLNEAEQRTISAEQAVERLQQRTISAEQQAEEAWKSADETHHRFEALLRLLQQRGIDLEA